MLHFRVQGTNGAERVGYREQATRPVDALRLEGELARRFDLRASTSESRGAIRVELGRWGSVSVDEDGATEASFVISGPAATGPLAAAVALAVSVLAEGEILEATGEIADVSAVERIALKGPVISTDAEARDAVAALRSGDRARLDRLALYVRVFNVEGQLRADLIAWCLQAAVEEGADAVAAARVAAAFGQTPEVRAREPKAEALFDAVRAEYDRFCRER